MNAHRYEPLDDRPDSESESPSAPPLVFDRDSIREVDRTAIKEYGIPGIVLMENAARALARLTLDMLDQSAGESSSVLIFCGSGNNGGDGYALARDLHNAGVEVTLVSLGAPKPETDADTNHRICQRMGLREISFSDVEQFVRRSEPDLVVDAIFGTGLDRPVTGEAAEAICWINTCRRTVLAVDVPSGLDCNTGKPVGGEGAPAVQATLTITFVGLKAGFLGLEAQKYLGEVSVIDIGAPPELLHRYGREAGVTHREAPEHQEQSDPMQSPRSH